MEIDLDGELVRLAYYFVANGSEEYPSAKRNPGLQAIHVEPHDDGAVIVACDGAWMFVAIDKRGYCDEPLNLSITVPIHCKLKPSAAEKIRVKATRKKGLTVWTRSGQIAAQGSAPWPAEDQGYPNWRQAIPDVSKLHMHFPANVGLRYLARIGCVWDDTNRRSNRAVFLGRNERQSLVVYFPDMQNIMLVGMPIYDDENLKPAAEWSDQFSQPAPEIDDDL